MAANRRSGLAGVLTLAAALAGCGGSDSSSGISLSQSSLRFYGIRGAKLGSQSLTATAGGTATYYPGVRVSPSAFAQVELAYVGGRSYQVQIRPRMEDSPSTMPLGRSTATVTLMACNDQPCTSVAFSTRVEVEVDVLEVSRTSLGFSASEGLPAATQSIAVTPSLTGSTLFSRAEKKGGGALPWLSIGRPDAATVTAAASASGLLAGPYTGDLVLSRPGMPEPLRLPVTLSVAPATLLPQGRLLTIDRAATDQTLLGSVAVDFQGNQSPTWTASSSVPWLALRTSTGSGAGAIAFSVDRSFLGGLGNWTQAGAQITVQAEGMAPVTWALQVDKRLPEIWSATTPLVAGRASPIKVFGRGLSQLAAADLELAGATGLEGGIVSDSEAWLQGVSLPEGNHALLARNPLAIPTRSVSVAAMTPNLLQAASVAHAGLNAQPVVDLRRGQVLAFGAGELVRYRLTGSGWSVDTAPMANLLGLALSTDGSVLYAGTGDYMASRVLVIDPETLVVRATLAPPYLVSLSYAAKGGAPVSTYDGRTWLTSAANGPAFVDATPAVIEFGPRGIDDYQILDDGYYTATRDGSVLLAFPGHAASSGGTFTDGRPWRYAPGDGRFARLADAPRAPLGAAFSDDGTRLLVDGGNLYDTRSWALLGTAPSIGVVAGSYSGPSGQLSPDGRRVYRPAFATYTERLLRVDVYDADALVPGTTTLVKLGEIPVAEDPSSCATGCSYATSMRVSPLGDVLFLLGYQRLLVVPIPPALSGVGAP